MIRVALDMDDLGLFALGEVAFGIHDDSAGNRTIGAGVARLGQVRELEGAN